MARLKQKVRRGSRWQNKSHKSHLPHPTPAASPTPPDFGTESGAVTRSGENEEMEGWCWERILCSDPEMLIRQASRQSEDEVENPLALRHREVDEKRQKESLRNPTDAMKEIMRRMEVREKERQQMSWQQQLQILTQSQRKANKSNSVWDLTPNPFTPAMEEVMRIRSTRVSFDYDVPITPDPSDEEEEVDIEEGNYDSDSSHEEYVPVSTKKSKNISAKRSGNIRRPLRNHFNLGDTIDIASLDSSLLRLLKADGVSVTQQRQELRRYNRALQEKKEPRDPAAPSTSPSEQTVVKSRRISIQNEVSPIRNKESPPEKKPTLLESSPLPIPPLQMRKKRLGKASERWIVKEQPSEQSKPLETVMEEEEMTVLNSFSPRRTRSSKSEAVKKTEPSEKKLVPEAGPTRATRSGFKRPHPQHMENSDTKAKVSKRMSEEDANASPQVKSSKTKQQSQKLRRGRSRCDNWSWASVLLSNPEDLLKARKAKKDKK